MAAFLDIYGFVAVLLRAAILALGSMAVGGVLFTFSVNRRLPLARAGRRLLAISSVSLAVTECLCLAANTAVLGGTTGLTLWELAGANFFGCGCISLVAATVLAYQAFRGREASLIALACAGLLLFSEAATSHAAARVSGQVPLLFFTAIHQGATAAWIGGLPYFILQLREEGSNETPRETAGRFSRLAMWSVALLLAGGVGLSFFYVGSAAAIYGTNYGLMVAAKCVLFVLVLGLGALNFRIVRELRAGDGAGDKSWTMRMSRIGEAEIGIGITIVLAAASLTSQPPGADLTADRVTVPTIVARMTPKVPRMETPPLSSLTPSTRETWKKAHPSGETANQAYIPGQTYQPATPGDIGWSEYNHHWAGLVVLVAGVLAVLSRFRLFGWAKHWPLAFTGLAAFLLLRADPEAWPLGPDGFWESFKDADVTQHRTFVLLIVVFAAFEWGVRTQRLPSQAAALVFPGVCALGGALLLTHTHAISNIQEAVLAELSHLPLALLAVVAGWSRWLELRYPGPRRAWAAHVWPVCFAMIGVVLLLYREA